MTRILCYFGFHVWRTMPTIHTEGGDIPHDCYRTQVCQCCGKIRQCKVPAYEID